MTTLVALLIAAAAWKLRYRVVARPVAPLSR